MEVWQNHRPQTRQQITTAMEKFDQHLPVWHLVNLAQRLPQQYFTKSRKSPKHFREENRVTARSELTLCALEDPKVQPVERCRCQSQQQISLEEFLRFLSTVEWSTTGHLCSATVWRPAISDLAKSLRSFTKPHPTLRIPQWSKNVQTKNVTFTMSLFSKTTFANLAKSWSLKIMESVSRSMRKACDLVATCQNHYFNLNGFAIGLH